MPAGSVLTASAHQLRNLATAQAQRQGTQSGALGARHDKARMLSNKTHYSPTDPDARISLKPGKVCALNCLCSLAVDTGHGVISHVQADLADSRDSQHLPRLLTGLQRRLQANELHLHEVLADAGYANGPNYARREAAHVTAWIPVPGQYKPAIEGFACDRRAAAFTCPEGKALPFQQDDTNQDGDWHKIYWVACRDCQQCPCKPTCAPRARRKQINRTIYDAAYRCAGSASTPGRGNGNDGCARARSSPSSGICCTTACAGSTGAPVEPARTKPCCWRPWPTTSKSASNTGPSSK